MFSTDAIIFRKTSIFIWLNLWMQNLPRMETSLDGGKENDEDTISKNNLKMSKNK